MRFFKRRKYGRDTKLHAGNALIGRLRRSLLDRNVPIWRQTAAKEMIVEDGRVVGVVVEGPGGEERLRADKGVLLAAGGFERNQEMREQYHRLPTSTDWNAGNERNVGDGIRMGMELGAKTDLMKEAWWTPVTLLPKSSHAWVLVVEKSMPGGLFVNKAGKRFCNEAQPYEDVGRAMYEGDAVPDAFMVFDATYRRNYPVGPVAPGYAMPDKTLPRKLREGFLIRAESLDELARKCEIDGEALKATIERFNTLAEKGDDEDFGRGKSASDRYYADPNAGVNPSLAPLKKAPFYAIRIYPGDLGTKGGLVTGCARTGAQGVGGVGAGPVCGGEHVLGCDGADLPGSWRDDRSRVGLWILGCGRCGQRSRAS